MLSEIFAELFGSVLEKWWRRWVPQSVNGKSRPQLRIEHGWKARTANLLCLGSAVAGLLFTYANGTFRKNDWRGIGLALFAMGLVPLLFLVFSSCRGGWGHVKEAYIYCAIAQKTPPVVMSALLGFCLLSGIVVLASLIGFF